MSARTRGRGTFRATGLTCTLALLLSSCALFHPQRVQVESQVLATITPSAIPAGSATPGASTGPRTVFVPGSQGTSGQANFASAPGVDAKTIKLGIIVPMDGPAAQLGKPLYRATQAYLNALNARGGINGRAVQLYLQTACLNCDQDNLLAAKTLVEENHVFALVNTYMNTYAFGAAMDYINRKQVPMVEGWTGVGDERISWDAPQTPWSVYYTVRNDDAVVIYARWLQEVVKHWSENGDLNTNPSHPYWVATVGLDVSQDNKRATEFKRVWESLGPDHKVVSQQRVAAQEETVTRMDSFIAAMKDAGANAAFSASNITMVFGMQAAARENWHVPWVSKSAWGRAAIDNCGSACDGGYTDNNGWGWPGTTPQWQQYMNVMRTYYPDGARYADAQTLGGWIGMEAFEYAASKLGANLTRQGLIDILGNLHNFDTGIGAVINTSPADHLGMGQTMMLQVCHNQFYRSTGWLSETSAMTRVATNGDCGWGW